MIETKQRIRVVGPPGSLEKSLAKALSNHSYLPVINLDEVFTEKEPTVALQRALSKEKWIVAGSLLHDDWARSTIQDATVIYFLNEPTWLCLLRVSFRRLKKLFSRKARQLYKKQVRLLLQYKQFVNNWKEHHPEVKTRMYEFSNVQNAYDHFVERSQPDLFM